MITWIKNENESPKPAVNTDNNWDKDNKISKTILVRVVDSSGRFSGFSFAKYFHLTQHWSIDGYHGTFTVSHWAEINEPNE